MLNKYLSLPIRIHFLIFVFLLAVPFLCIIIYVGIMERKDALRDAQNECFAFVNIIAREEQILVTGIRQLATAIAILPEAATRDRHRIDPLLKKILKDNPQYTNITISDEHGRILESAMPFKDGMSVAHQKYFKDTVRTGTFSSGEYSIGRMTKKPIMIFGYPVKNAAGQLTRVIGIGIDFIDIRHVFEKLNLPAGSSFSLLDHKGTILYRHLQDNLSTSLMGNKDIKKDIFTKMQEGPEGGTFTAEGNDGSWRIFAYKKMTLPHEAQPYLYIRSSIPESSAMDKASQRLFLALSVISLFSFAGFFWAWFIGKRIIVDRITALENASKQLATGTPVAKVSQVVQGGDLGELAKAIDRMMETIAEKEVTLRTVLEAVNDSLFMIDNNGTVLALNTTTAERFRKRPEEILGENIYDLMPEQLAKARRSHQEEAIQSGKVVRFEDERAGRWVESTLYPVDKDLPDRIVIYGRDITERKRLEEELKRERAQLFTIFDQMAAEVSVLDPHTREILFMNRYARELYGESTGLFCYDVFHGGDAPCPSCNIERLLGMNNDGFIQQEVFSEPIGRHYLTTNKLIGWPDGRRVKLEISIDITDKKQAEKALKDSESKYQFLAESMADVVFTLDLNLMTTYVSPSIEKMLGYAPEERMAQEIDEQLTPKSRKLVSETLAAELDREKERGADPARSRILELEYYHKDCSIRHLVTYLRGIRDNEGNLTGIYGSHHDITERKQAEESLRKSEENYRQLFNNSPSAIYKIDFRTGRFLKANHVICEYLGCSPEEITSLSPYDLMTNASKQLLSERLTKIGSGENVADNPEYEIVDKNGKHRWIQLNSKNFFDAEGLVIGADVVAHEITDQKRAEEERRILEERLQRAEKMEAIGQLAGGVAHDLNNVLGILSGYSELLLLETPEGSRSRGHAEKILQSTEKGAAIIQDLLTLARRGVTASDVINLNNVVSGFLKTPVFEKMKDYNPHVTFRTECDKNLLNIKGSPVHLEKTLMNLMSNAAESISGTGEVTIRTESRYLDKPLWGYDEVKEGDYAVLTVSDTGSGIPAENRKKIFEPFYTKKKMGRSGTGLGLAIVWGTVKDHNGYIDIQTEVGAGTTFTLYFPVTREELIAQQQKTPIERYMGNGESVLVVDDIAEQRDVASGLLTQLGYQVRVVSSGEEAVEYLKSNKADILVLDMIMAPGIDGLSTYQRIVGINPKQKAIIVSGFSETERVKEAQKLGAGAYVRKPYTIEKIGMAVREELSRK
jgi:PAS domain S-box-containing protein